MKNQKRIKQTLLVVLTVIAAGFLTGGACEDSPAGKALEQCGFACADAGLIDGNASITGVASIDGFFGSVVNFDVKATKVSGDINASLAAIADSVDLAGGAEADFGAGFQAAVAAKFNLDASAGIKIDYQPAKCEVSASASIEATAKCDVDVDAGSVKASCSGGCEVDPGSIDVSAKCEGSVDAKAKCTGTAPSLNCEAECVGGCELEVAASCEGTCNGTCNGTCSVENADGSCSGQCDGTCQGSCEMEAGASCSGKCTGSCEYEPADGSCEAGAKAEIYCEATADGTPPKVECSGSCDAEITPPSASAECEASAKAEAEINAECTPPSIGVTYEFDATAMASLDATAQAEAKAKFKAWLSMFKTEMGNIVAAMAQAKIVLKAGEGIVTAAGSAVTNAGSELVASGDMNLGVAFKLTNCLPAQLKAVGGIITTASAKMEASVKASGSLMTSLGK